MPDGNIRFGRQYMPNCPNKHRDLSGDSPVLAAGDVTFSNGRVVSLSNDSGHYNRTLTPLQVVTEKLQALFAFRENGLPVQSSQYVTIH